MQGRVSGRGYPGHGAVIGNLTARIVEYIKHRQLREEEVVRVLRFGTLDAASSNPLSGQKTAWTPTNLGKVIYYDVPESLHDAAARGVLQVLTKLEKEGKVEHDSISGMWMDARCSRRL
jgi:endoribonuclease LACTB2